MDAPSTTLPLRFNRIAGTVALPRQARPAVAKARPNDPATSIMTDFASAAMFSIHHDAQIDHALEYMKAVGVRLLFVLNDDNQLAGLITSTDILGERPTRYMSAVDSNITRSDVLVKHIMSALADWIVLDYRDVQKASIAQIIATFKSAGMRHLVVTDGGRAGMAVRGVISATRVEQALDITLNIVRRANTFAEIESAVVRA